MQQKNRIEVTGYLTARPALRHLPSGTPVANVRLGESYPYLRKARSSSTPTGTRSPFTGTWPAWR
jgi:hypothetical protein